MIARLLLLLAGAAWLAAPLNAGDSSSPRFKNVRLYSDGQQQVAAVSPSRPQAPESAHFTTVLKAPSPQSALRPSLPESSARSAPAPGDWSLPLWAAAAGLAAGLAALLPLARAWRKRASARQTAALAVMAHELKTPLSAIETYLELMVHEGAAADHAQAKQWLDDVRHLKSTTAGLRQTVNDLLEAAQLESGRLKLSRTRVDLRAIAEDCLRLHAPRAQAGNVALSLEAPDGLPAADADAGRLRQVFHNLLSNALRHTPSGGGIRVTVRLPGEDGLLRCAIGDSGPGIAPEDHGRLFKKFSRLKEREGGAGLGLYICRAIVEAHGGRIWVESGPGRGSEFCFTIGVFRDA